MHDQDKKWFVLERINRKDKHWLVVVGNYFCFAEDLCYHLISTKNCIFLCMGEYEEYKSFCHSLSCECCAGIRHLFH